MKNYIKKYLQGECSEKELQESVSMLQGKYGEDALNNELREYWGSVSGEVKEGMDKKFNNTLYRIHHHVNVNEKKTDVTIQLYRNFAKIAAILLLPLMCAFSYFVINYYYMPQDDSVATLHVPSGITSEVLLPDGSKVILNSSSTLTYPISFKGINKRIVKLTGEGYFEVESNELKPFIVETTKVGVEVLGTTFNVKAYDDDPDISVALVEGSVKLIDIQGDGEKDLTVLKSGELAVLNKGKNKLNINRNRDLKDILSWKDGKIILKNEPVDSILRKMARKYNVKFRIDNERILDYRITAKIIHETLEQFLKILVASSPLKYEIVGGQKKDDGSYSQRIIIIKLKNRVSVDAPTRLK